MTRYVKIYLVLFVGLWALFGALENFENYRDGVSAASATLGMEGTRGGGDQWRSVTSPIAGRLAFAAIALGKLAAGVVCLIGVRHLWQARSEPAAAFNAAKKMGILGCGIAVAMLFSVFIVVGESYFMLWQTEMGAHALPMAFRYLGSIGIVLLFVGMPEQD